MTVSASPTIKKLILLFLVIAGLYYAQQFLIPLAIGGVLATLFLPVCQWLEAHKVNKALAALLCVLILLIGIAGVGALLTWQISELARDAATIKEKAIDAFNQAQQFIYTHLGISAEKQSEMIKEQQPQLNGVLSGFAVSMAGVFTAFILIMVYIFCLLYYRMHIKNFVLKLSGPEQRDETEQLVYSAANVSQQYLVGLAKMIVCLWIMYSIGFSIAGVKNPIFFAVLCGLLEIIPFIGNITGTTLTVLVTAVQGASLPMIGGIILTYGVVQFIQGWVLEPLIVGKQVKINPLFTILALVLGEMLWGIPGIILAIPLTAMFKIACDHIEPLKPYGYLIGETREAQKESGLIKKLKEWWARLTGKNK